MNMKKVNEFSEIDWDLYRYYRLGSFNLIEVRKFLKEVLNAYLNNSSVHLNKSHADCIFRFLQDSNLAYVNPNKKSVFHRVGKETRK